MIWRQLITYTVCWCRFMQKIWVLSHNVCIVHDSEAKEARNTVLVRIRNILNTLERGYHDHVKKRLHAPVLFGFRIFYSNSNIT